MFFEAYTLIRFASKTLENDGEGTSMPGKIQNCTWIESRAVKLYDFDSARVN